jgi:hypothetical protein
MPPSRKSPTQSAETSCKRRQTDIRGVQSQTKPVEYEEMNGPTWLRSGEESYSMQRRSCEPREIVASSSETKEYPRRVATRLASDAFEKVRVLRYSGQCHDVEDLDAGRTVWEFSSKSAFFSPWFVRLIRCRSKIGPAARADVPHFACSPSLKA